MLVEVKEMGSPRDDKTVVVMVVAAAMAALLFGIIQECCGLFTSLT